MRKGNVNSNDKSKKIGSMEDKLYKKNTNKDQNSRLKRPLSTTKQKVILGIWIIVVIFVIFEIFRLMQYTLGKVDKDKLWLYNGVSKVVGMFVSNKPSETKEEHSLKFAGLGDIYVTTNMLKGSKEGSSYDFTLGTESVKTVLKDFDVVTASLATPVADKGLGYSSNNIYNTPVEILDTIKEMNVSTIATATKHAMDKGEKGITQTLANIKEKGINQVGIGTDTRSEPVIISKNEINIGVLSYTSKSNVKLSKKQDMLINILDEEELKKDINFLKEKNVDYIVSYLNTAQDTSLMTKGEQKSDVEKLFAAGVNVVLGTGSTVVQEDVQDEIDINNEKSHVYAIYGLGDFMGTYKSADNQLSIISNIEFTKEITKNKKGEIIKTQKDMKVKAPIALWTEIAKDYSKKIYILDDEIKAYNENKSEFTEKQYKEMLEAQTRITKTFN
ncbi:MAG: CapA family protein [Clostridia bacterium]